MIKDILEDKKAQILTSGGTKRASFTKDDIDTMMDLNELRVFKLANPMPKDFTFSSSEKDSMQRVLDRGDIYDVFEYCVISQPVLQHSVSKVFKNWRFINGVLGVRQH